MPRRARQPPGQAPGLQPLANLIGERGEDIFKLAITDYQYFQRPLFKPGFLGDKWPTVDFYVEALGIRGSTPFFLAQVKSTNAPLDPNINFLSVRATKQKCIDLYKLHGPTYIVGVHEPSRRTFILSVHARPNQGVYRIPFDFELTPDNMRRLHQEVSDFWTASHHKPARSHFT
jgi:hypothetical protein